MISGSVGLNDCQFIYTPNDIPMFQRDVHDNSGASGDYLGHGTHLVFAKIAQASLELYWHVRAESMQIQSQPKAAHKSARSIHHVLRSFLATNMPKTGHNFFFHMTPLSLQN